MRWRARWRAVKEGGTPWSTFRRQNARGSSHCSRRDLTSTANPASGTSQRVIGRRLSDKTPGGRPRERGSASGASSAGGIPAGTEKQDTTTKVPSLVSYKLCSTLPKICCKCCEVNKRKDKRATSLNKHARTRTSTSASTQKERQLVINMSRSWKVNYHKLKFLNTET